MSDEENPLDAALGEIGQTAEAAFGANITPDVRDALARYNTALTDLLTVMARQAANLTMVNVLGTLTQGLQQQTQQLRGGK